MHSGEISKLHKWWNASSTTADWKLLIELLDARAAGREVLTKALNAVLDARFALGNAGNDGLGTCKGSRNGALCWCWWRWTWWRWTWWRWTWWGWASTVGADTSTLDGLARASTAHGVTSTERLLVSGWRADKSTLLVTGGRRESTLRSSGHTRWDVGRASGGLAVRGAEGTREALDLNGLFVSLTAVSWVPVVGLVGADHN